jgi:hypothetical protein
MSMTIARDRWTIKIALKHSRTSDPAAEKSTLSLAGLCQDPAQRRHAASFLRLTQCSSDRQTRLQTVNRKTSSLSCSSTNYIIV